MKKVKRKVLKQLLKVIDIFFLCVFLSLRMIAYALPASVVYGIASALGYALYYVIPGSRKRLFRIVSEAMPELTDSEHIKRIGRSSVVELYNTMFDLAVYARHRERLIKNAVIEGRANLERADSFGKGVIIASVHIGGWPMGIIASPRMGIDATLIGINPDFTPTPHFVRAAYKFAESLGCGEMILTGSDTVGQSLEVLKQKKRLIFAADVIGEEIVEMFGRPATIAGGMGRIACDSGAPVVPVYIFRDKGPWKFRASFREPILCQPTGNRSVDVNAIIQAVISSVESEIRLVPEQWTQWSALGKWWNKAEELKKAQSAPRPGSDQSM